MKTTYDAGQGGIDDHSVEKMGLSVEPPDRGRLFVICAGRGARLPFFL